MTDFIATTKVMSLSLRLLRKEKTIEDAFRKDHGFKEVEAKKGRLFLEQNSAHAPSWAKFIGEFSQTTLQQLYNQSCSAILFLEIKIVDSPDTLPRTMALSFGGGFHALDLNTFERNFGLRVALNSISRENLRNVDVATLDTTVFQKRIQSSRKADLSGFGINIHRDLLRLAGGSRSLNIQACLRMPAAASQPCWRRRYFGNANTANSRVFTPRGGFPCLARHCSNRCNRSTKLTLAGQPSNN